MAGFDFYFEKSALASGLQRAILRSSQRTSKELGLTLTWRTADSRVFVEVNGSLPSMWALHEYLANDFQIIASSYPEPARRADRLRVASDMLAAFREGLLGITEAIHEISEQYNGVPHSIVFDYGTKTHLARVLRSLTRVLVLDMQGLVPSRTVVEEAHSALEQVLRTYLGRGARNLNLEEIIDKAGQQDAITASQSTDLQRLRILRNSAKHANQDVGQAEARNLVAVAVEALHKVLATIRKSPNRNENFGKGA